ncbi:carbon-nitrogen hydrolase family protein [Nocardioides allogilvus]|uniref:carbon-nitrogen hydrolase family protein n=1 Tax=Nocardioides allogilvus TaxID=2072017 RepID=UPI001E57BB23|nr:carbon-nitrogen hydrolase family protein [Nocardioides allogilvus]
MSLAMATCQPTASSDPRANGAEVRRMLRVAAAAGARLAHFPEGFLSGYAVADVAAWEDVDWSAVRRELEEVAALAGELGIWVVLGSAHPLTPPHWPHNSLYVISDQGELVDRYDKRKCSNTELTRFYTPGFEPVVVDVDGFRFGLALCIEVNFEDLFAEYRRLGVDCVLLSAYPVDSIFETKARAHAAIHNYWLSLSVPAQRTHLFHSGLIGPHGEVLADVGSEAGLVIGTLDRGDPALHVALDLAKPWRALARAGDIYEERRVDDERSRLRTESAEARVITLCGSTRFEAEFAEVNQRLTMDGYVVISLGMFGTVDGSDLKERLGALHFQKIRMADEVYVVDPGGYLGESTRREIAYAGSLGKPVRYLSRERPA